MIPTEWPPCSRCLQNSRTFESCGKSTVHQGHQRCSALMQILHPFVHSCLSCNRNLKCKPWRRKFLSQPFAKWTLLNAVQWMALILLLLNYFQQSIQILARTFSVRKNPRLSSLRGLLSMVLFGGLFLLPLASCQDNLQPTPSVKSLQLPNTMVYVGSSFVYNISEEVFDCEVESFVVSETADRFLSHWLAYNSNKRQLYGVPSEKDEGIYNILVVALSKDGDKVRGRVCGSRSFFIKVVPVSEELMMSIYPGADTSGSNIKTVQSLPCVPGSQVIHGTIILNVDVHNMNGHERMILLLKMADHLNVHSNKVSLFSGQASHPLIGQLDNPVVMAAGAGDGRFTKGSRSLLTWHMGCGAIRLEEVAFSKLETSAQDGSISSLLGGPVVGWHVMSGTQKNMAKRRVRRQVMGMTATPIPSSALPSRMSNISTSVIISRSVVITSESTTSVSSVVLNRTEVSSFTIISANTTRGSSQLPSRTDVQSSVFANVTSSARSFSASSIMRTKSVSINSSTVTLSRNTTLPVQSSELMSSLNRTTQIMPSSIVSQSLNSTYITRTVKMTIVSSFLTLSSSVPARNSSSVSPNETTVVGSSSSAFPSVNRTLRTSSAVGTSSLNLTLTSPTLRVSSSLETRTSSLATPSSKQLLIASSRLTSSASPHLTTHLPPSVAISTPPLNVSTSPAMSLTISRQTSLTVSLSSSFVSSRNTSVQEASSTVSQTSLSVIAVTSSSTSLLSRSLSSPSSLVGLETTAFMENASTPQLNSTAALGTVVPTLTSIISTSTDILLKSSAPTLISLVPSPSSTIPPFSTVNLSISSTVAILNTSIPMITSIGGSANSTISFVSPSLPPSSLILPSSSVVSSASSVRINITSVIHVASSSIQVNVTSPSVVLSLTSSPIATSINSTQTSAVISVDTSNSTFSSNFTRNVTPTDFSVTLSITPSSSVIIPTTAPANSPPRLYNNIGRVSAPAGKALYFTIPDDTFYDAEDQNTTRGLSLSVSLANGTSIPTDYWLQFENTSQTIYGLPLSEHVPSGVTGEGFLLRAKDSQGAEALDAFEVFVVPSEKPIVQELKVRTTNDFIAFSRNLSERLSLLERIADYYGDSDSSLIRVLSFTSGSVVMAWTNDSLPTDTCDVEKVDYVENKLLLPDGQVREEFRNALPEFPVESASQQRFGVCNGTDEGTPLPPGAQSTEDKNLWYKHVLVGVFVVFVVFVLTVLLIWYCRRRRPKPSNEKRTFKKRKPIVLGPEIELKPIPGKPLVLPDDDPSLPPSYISKTSLDKPVYSDDEDEMDYGKRSLSVVYEPPPPFHATLADDPRNSPPPAYLMPPLY